MRLNEYLEHPVGITIFQHACKMGLEGIVSKRLGSRYHQEGRLTGSRSKNPEAPAVSVRRKRIGHADTCASWLAINDDAGLG